MNTKLILPFIALAGLLFESCKRDELAGMEAPALKATSGKAENFNSALPAALVLKPANWSATDSITIVSFALKDSAVVDPGKKYTTNGDGKFTSANPITYPANTLVNFVAFYPYKANIVNNIYPLDVSSQSNVIEFMYANSATNFNANSQTTPYLAFNSQVATINLNITAAAGVADINGISVTIPDVATKADFNLKTGAMANVQRARITTTATATGAAQTVSVATLAGTDMSGKQIVMKLTNGREYVWNFPSGSVLGNGVKANYNITLQPPFEQQLFLENCGTTNVTATTLVNVFTGWTNNNIIFSDPANLSAIRLNAAMVGNHVLLANGANVAAGFKISGINTKYATKLTLKFSLAANAANSNQNELRVRYNGIDFVLPSVVIPDNTSRRTISIDLSSVPNSDTGEIEFNNIVAGGTTVRNFRIDDIELRGTR